MTAIMYVFPRVFVYFLSGSSFDVNENIHSLGGC